MFEKLIETLVALTAALNNLAAAYKGGTTVTPVADTPAEEKKGRKGKAATEVAAPTPAAETTAAAPTAPAVPTVQELREAATALLTLMNNNVEGFFDKINVEHKVARISEVPEASRADVIARINKRIAEVKTTKASAEAI
jgi:hypothetical protein